MAKSNKHKFPLDFDIETIMSNKGYRPTTTKKVVIWLKGVLKDLFNKEEKED